MTVADAQFAGVYRRRLGEVLVTALNDGSIELPAAAFVGITPEEREAFLRAQGCQPPFLSSINAFLLQWGSRTVLVDTGAGKLFGDACGQAMGNLRSAGVTPAEVTDVVLSHMHGDHVGGSLDGSDAPAFPNAAVWVAETEIAFWLSDERKAASPEARRSSFDTARKMLAPYAQRTHRFAYGEIMPGLEAIAMPGHTPGHTGFLVTSGAERLLIWGDVFHLPVLQAARPDIGTAFDSDPARAIETRKDALDRATREGLLVTGMHMSFPGFARIARAEAGYVVQPEVWRTTL